MRLLSLVLPLTLLVASALATMDTASGAPTLGAPPMDKTRAIERAAQFCRAIGAPVSGDATAQFPARDRAGVPPLHWRPRWHVVFKGAEVDVVDGTGVVCLYRNHAPYQPWPNDKPIPEAEAIKRADAVIQATGQKEQLGPPKATFIAITISWVVSRQRLYQGVPYHEDHVTVRIQPRTGQVESVYVKHSMAPPKVASMKALLILDQDQAVQRARAHLTEVGLDGTGAQLLRAERASVQPNTFWQDGRATNRLGVPARPAWMLLFKIGERNAYFVWIDTQTGRVIGGDDASKMGAPLLWNPAEKPVQPAPKK